MAPTLTGCHSCPFRIERKKLFSLRSKSCWMAKAYSATTTALVHWPAWPLDLVWSSTRTQYLRMFPVNRLSDTCDSALQLQLDLKNWLLALDQNHSWRRQPLKYCGVAMQAQYITLQTMLIFTASTVVVAESWLQHSFSLIIMQARDASIPTVLPRMRWVTVTRFMEALLPESAYNVLFNSLPTFRREGEDLPFGQTFENYRLWFNHIIKVDNSKVIKAEFLWKYITRGAMIVCKNNQYGVDIILPVCLMQGHLSRTSISAIYIQVKNTEGFTLKVNNTLFHAMNPFQLGLFSNDPRPIIRLVFALGSPDVGVQFPSREHVPHHPDRFTSFDVWCAGLSTDTFRQIGNDINSYRVLLDRSLQPHDIFNLKEANYEYLGDDTKAARGNLRRSMAPLVMFEGHDRIHQ